MTEDFIATSKWPFNKLYWNGTEILKLCLEAL